MVPNNHHFDGSKKHIKPLEIQQFASERPQNDIIEIYRFLTDSSTIMKLLPGAPGERPEAPRALQRTHRRASDIPDKHQKQYQ